MCCKSRERPNWTFYCAAFSFSEGVINKTLIFEFVKKFQLCLTMICYLQRRKKTQKPGFWSYSSTMLGKDFRELSSFLGSSSMSGRENVHDSAPDPLLSTFICNVPFSDPKCNQEDGRSSTIAASTTSDVPRYFSSEPM